MFACLSVYLLSVCLSFCLSVSLTTSLYVDLSGFLPFCLFICLYDCLTVCLSVSLSACLSCFVYIPLPFLISLPVTLLSVFLFAPLPSYLSLYQPFLLFFPLPTNFTSLSSLFIYLPCTFSIHLLILLKHFSSPPSTGYLLVIPPACLFPPPSLSFPASA